ncbi:hypothetical protein LS48_12590 [Aequorivita aquimaris]|uniref:Uncharacterized protein n=1 Tax=Aequorivita aquimaris TaxID=1548749 RepID=A0A137RFG6_9FLAO|nr:hypothetical protein LS48_12590 [Aequorivita aquimaris]
MQEAGKDIFSSLVNCIIEKALKRLQIWGKKWSIQNYEPLLGKNPSKKLKKLLDFSFKRIIISYNIGSFLFRKTMMHFFKIVYFCKLYCNTHIYEQKI